MRAAKTCLATIILPAIGDLHAQSSVGDGVEAFLHGDYDAAIRVLRPLADRADGRWRIEWLAYEIVGDDMRSLRRTCCTPHPRGRTSIATDVTQLIALRVNDQGDVVFARFAV